MHYAEMVSLPVTALIQLDYDTYSNLINSCMHEIIVLERKQHDESDPIKYYGYSIKLYKLNRVFWVLRYHKHYLLYKASLVKRNYDLTQAA
jgi:hypothetical protein